MTKNTKSVITPIGTLWPLKGYRYFFRFFFRCFPPSMRNFCIHSNKPEQEDCNWECLMLYIFLRYANRCQRFKRANMDRFFLCAAVHGRNVDSAFYAACFFPLHFIYFSSSPKLKKTDIFSLVQWTFWTDCMHAATTKICADMKKLSVVWCYSWFSFEQK